MKPRRLFTGAVKNVPAVNNSRYVPRLQKDARRYRRENIARALGEAL